MPDFRTANLSSPLDFKSTLVSVLVLLLPGLLSCSLILQSPEGLMDEITHVINTVLKCKHQDDLSYGSQN